MEKEMNKNNMTEKIPTTGVNQEKQDVREIIFEAVAELELPIKIIIEKIQSRIENGEYGLIIGDDASGRIPTLILGNFIKTISEQRGLKKPNIIFIPGKLMGPILNLDSGMRAKSKKLENHIAKFGATKDKRILIVTDTVLSGDSLKILVTVLHEIGFTCDIATIGVETDEKDLLNRDSNLHHSEVISGEYYNEDGFKQHTPKIYRAKTLSGVTKKAGQTKSTTVKSTESDEEEKKIIQDQINQAREDASVVTDHLINWYQAQDKLLQNEK